MSIQGEHSIVSVSFYLEGEVRNCYSREKKAEAQKGGQGPPRPLPWDGNCPSSRFIAFSTNGINTLVSWFVLFPKMLGLKLRPKPQ